MLRLHESAKAIWAKAKIEARRVGLVSQFAKVLMYLNGYANHENFKKPKTRVTLYYDWAPYSFSLVWERRDEDGNWKQWFQGGLIYHGPHDNGGGGGPPTFSVNLSPHYGWSVHT